MRHWGSVLVAMALSALAFGVVGDVAQATPAHGQTAGTLRLAAAPSLVVAIKHDARIDGAPAVLVPDSRGATRQWLSNAGQTTFVNKATGKCLTVGSPMDALGATQRTCARGSRSHDHQLWLRVDAGANRFKLMNVATGKCLTAEGVAPGDRLYQDDCDQRPATNSFTTDTVTVPVKHPVRSGPVAAIR